MTVGLARPSSASQSTIARIPSGEVRPLNRPELTSRSSGEWAMYAPSSASSSVPAGAMTRRMGSPKRVANAKSRSSWAGTAMIAPVP